MRKRRLLASLAVAAGLGIGGLAGIVLGVPSVSAAQTTTTVPSAEDPAPTTPADPGAEAPADRPPHDDDADCPNMGGESDGSGSGAGASDGAAAFPRGPRGGAPVQSL
ncbi:MAG TPA: hypothetical protein VF244_00850 [Acidimicrobiales bacterium]